LDDLGQARYLVEYQAEVRKRKHGDDQEPSESVVPEKKYRFGVAPTRKTEAKKAGQDSESSPKKVTIVEVEGVMKKLVELSDGVVCHVVMTEKEVAAHKVQQEKERKDKEKKEKEQLEKQEKDRQEAEKRKKEAEEKEKKAMQEFKETPAIILNLPLVSEVPEPKKADNDKESKESKGGAMSKLASKLLSFIKKPVSKLKGSDSKSPTDSVAPALKTTDAQVTKEDNISESTSATLSPILDEKAAPVVEVSDTTKILPEEDEKPEKKNMKIDDGDGEQPKQTILQVPVNNLVERLRDRPITPVTSVSSNKTRKPSPPSSEMQSNTSAAIVKSDPPKPVDHLALLASLSSPFATPKVAKKPDMLKSNSASSTVSSSPSAKSTLKSTEAEEEDELLGEEDETMSDIDESILEDSHHHPVVQKPKPNTNINKKVTAKKKSTTPVKVKKSTSPKLPTVAAKSKNILSAAKALRKKKKKEKHANETKEERRVRKLKKKEKKDKEKAEKQSGGEVLQSISTISGNVSNPQWNVPFMNDESPPVAPRQRSATWTPSYYPTYHSQQPQQHTMQTVVQQPQQAMQQSPLVMNSAAVAYHQHSNQPVQQISTMPQQISITQQQRQQQQVTGKSQLYIDEFGQTYTLEEETYIVGPTGQLQAVNHNAVSTATSAMYLQQQQQQQQQYATQQASLLYAQQQHARYM